MALVKEACHLYQAEGGFDVSKPCVILNEHSLLSACGLRCEISVTPVYMPAGYHASRHDGDGLNL